MSAYVDPYLDGTAITSLTDSTTGTASNTINDTTSSVKG